MRDHTPLEPPAFNGRYARGDKEKVPYDRLITAINVDFSNNQIKTRDGILEDLANHVINRTYVYQKTGEAPKLLVLKDNGKLYDSSASMSSAILDIAAMTDFSAVTLFNRVYITPHDGVTGLSGEEIYVYTGSGTARKIAGTPPSASGMTAAVSATAGNVQSGKHAFACVFESDTGFFSEAGSFINLVSDGTKKVDLASIPTGPSGTVSRHILATKIIDDFKGDYANQEWFFVPSGEIADNSTTILTINFYDEDLYDSADYLFDVFSEVPAGLGLAVYNGRLISWGENANTNYVRVSEEGDPEIFNEIDGFIATNPNDGTGAVQNCFVSRGQLYIFKTHRTFVSTDNGGPAATWNLDKVDSFLGAYPHSVGVLLDSNENTVTDNAIIANPSGLYLFDGKFSEFPLSYNDADTWDTINKAAFNKVQVLIDPFKDTIYLNIPINASTVSDQMFVYNYENGLDVEQVKISTWTFTNTKPISLTIELDSTTKAAILKLASNGSNGANGIHKFVADRRRDNSNAIPTPTIRFAYAQEGEGDNHFGGVRITAIGSGTLDITLFSLDESDTLSPTGLTLASTYKAPLQRNFDFVTWKCSAQLSVDTIDEWFRIINAKLYANVLAEERPCLS